MNLELHMLHGLDHKCRRCGRGLNQHDEELSCPSETVTNPVADTYSPKGPQVPAYFWKLVLDQEDAAIMLLDAKREYAKHAAGTEASDAAHVAMLIAKERYKQKRFMLNAFVATATDDWGEVL